MTVTISHIERAHALIGEHIVRTPCIASAPLSALSGAEVVLKLENFQHTGSFKPRGALNKLLSLNARERALGVVAASAGNHAQGVAYHAQRLGIPALIVMPKTTPFTKVGRTEALGAQIVLTGDDLNGARDHALDIAAKEGRIFVHPYDDERIIAGQGSIGLEILHDSPFPLDTLIVPIGGGGLIAGIAVALKAHRPDLEIIGAEAALYPSMSDALRGTGDDRQGIGGQTVAEGIAVKAPGEITRKIVKSHVSDILLANEASLEHAVQVYLETQRIVVEGAGAASLAVLLDNPERFKGRRVGLIVSGGNIDSRVLASVLMRGLVRAGRLVRLRVKIFDAPGALATVSTLIGETGANIVEVYHQRLFSDVPIKQADMDVVVETVDKTHVRSLLNKLNAAGFPTRLMSETSGEAISE